jgi:hypothetical protein
MAQAATIVTTGLYGEVKVRMVPFARAPTRSSVPVRVWRCERASTAPRVVCVGYVVTRSHFYTRCSYTQRCLASAAPFRR